MRPTAPPAKDNSLLLRGNSNRVDVRMHGQLQRRPCLVKLDGSLKGNLEGAIASARRLRGQPVYPETLQYWSELASFAWRDIGSRSGPQVGPLANLVRQLEEELASRRAVESE